jgi:hypothetical protein
MPSFGAGLGMVISSGLAIPMGYIQHVRRQPARLGGLAAGSVAGARPPPRRRLPAHDAGVAAGDFDLLFALTAVAAGLVALSSLVTDLVPAWLDPRLRSRA